MSIIVEHRRGTRANAEANTPAAGEIWFDTTLNALRQGDGSTLGGWLSAKWGRKFTVTPAQITANQNDYNPTDMSVAERLLINSNAAVTITGLAGGATDRTVVITNKGSFKITLSNGNASSLAANRFNFGADVVLNPLGSIELEYDAAASLWLRSNGGTKFSTVPEEFLLQGVITPAQITTAQNDYAPADSVTATKTFALASIVRLSSNASQNITGLADARSGAIKLLVNVGTNPVVLVDGSASSLAANRFAFGQNITLAAKQSATIEYDATDGFWKLIASTAGGAVAAGAVTAQTLAGSALGAASGMINGTIVESHTGGAATFAIKTLAGADPSAADPVYAIFQNGTGGYVAGAITAALSVTISSGSSMGLSNAQPGRLWLPLVYTGSAVVLGAVNCSDGVNILRLPENFTYSTTAEGGAGAADSAQTIYTAAAQTSKYICLAGYADYNSGVATAGTWNVSPDNINLCTSGTPRPGDVIQTRNGTTGAGTTVTSTTKVLTNSAVTIVLKSKCNAVRLRADYDWLINSNANPVNAQFGRGGTTTLVGSTSSLFTNVAGIGVGAGSNHAYDFPATSGSLVYTLVMWGAGVTSATLPAPSSATNITPVATMQVEEIMG